MRIVALGLVAMVCGCGTAAPKKVSKTPNRVMCPPCSRGGAVVAVVPRGEVIATKQNPLSAHVPRSAVAATVIYETLMPVEALERDVEMRDRLAAFLTKAVGIDLTRVREVVAFATAVEPRLRWALLFPLAPAQISGGLKGRPVGRYAGVPLVRVESRVVAALTATGLVVGDTQAVRAAIDLGRGRQRPVGPGDPLEELARFDDGTHDLVAAVHLGSLRKMSAEPVQLGMQVATLTYGPQRRVALRVAGDPVKMESAAQMLKIGVAALLGMVQQRMVDAERGNKVIEGVSGIVGYYQIKRLVEEIDPRLVDGRLTATYQLPDQEAMLLPFLGVLAAVAIPAYEKYVKRAKVAEAKVSLGRIEQALTAYHSQRWSRSKSRFRWPRSTGWSPQRSCCAGPTAPKCPIGDRAFNHPSWRALGFTMTEPHHFQVRLTSRGQGRRATVVLEARGDPSCDGKVATHWVEGVIDGDGRPRFTEPSIR